MKTKRIYQPSDNVIRLLSSLINENPFASSRVYAYNLNLSGITISHTTVFSYMKHHLGLSFKKTKTLLPTKHIEQLHEKRRCFESYRKTIDVNSVAPTYIVRARRGTAMF